MSDFVTWHSYRIRNGNFGFIDSIKEQYRINYYVYDLHEVKIPFQDKYLMNYWSIFNSNNNIIYQI